MTGVATLAEVGDGTIRGGGADRSMDKARAKRKERVHCKLGARCTVAWCVVHGAWCVVHVRAVPLGRSTDALAYGKACGNIPGPDNSLHEWLSRAAIVPSNGLLAIGSFGHRNEPDGLTA